MWVTYLPHDIPKPGSCIPKQVLERMILVAAEVTKLLILPLRFLLMIVFSYINIAIAMYVVSY